MAACVLSGEPTGRGAGAFVGGEYGFAPAEAVGVELADLEAWLGAEAATPEGSLEQPASRARVATSASVGLTSARGGTSRG